MADEGWGMNDAFKEKINEGDDKGIVVLGSLFFVQGKYVKEVAGNILRSRVSAVRSRVQVFSARFRFGTRTRTRTRKPVPDTRWPRPGT
jgi:hypothetical protein